MSLDKSQLPPRGTRRLPRQSVLYDLVVPVALVAMGILLVVIVALASGFLLGVIRW